MFSYRIENHGPGWHIHPHCKGFCSKQHLDKIPRKEEFNHFFQDWQQASMVLVQAGRSRLLEAMVIQKAVIGQITMRTYYTDSSLDHLTNR